MKLVLTVLSIAVISHLKTWRLKTILYYILELCGFTGQFYDLLGVSHEFAMK
jgi:hypothetical protein